MFEALAEPNRRKLLDLIRVRERSVGELVGLMSLSQPGVSKHLRILREAGLVSQRKDATQRMYRLNPASLQEAHSWFEPYRQYWSNKLDELEKHLDDEQSGGQPC